MLARYAAVVLCCTATAAFPLLTPPAPAQSPSTTALTVRLPADAKLFIDGTPTTQAGAVRTFTIPALQAGTYNYALRADVVRAGKPLSETKKISFQAGKPVEVDFTALDRPAAPPAAPDDVGWPRRISGNDATAMVYPPHYETWDKDRLTGRAPVVVIENNGADRPTFGLIRFTARTIVVKDTVTLDDFKVVKAHFPAAPALGKKLAAMMKAGLPAGTTTVVLDHLEANLAFTKAEDRQKEVPFKHEPPRILYTTQPALLVQIDGQPTPRPVANSTLQRVINTRALLLRDPDADAYYLHFADRWLQAKAVAGPWAFAAKPPEGLEAVKKAVAKDPRVDLLSDTDADLKRLLARGGLPKIFVNTEPAELLEFEGEPQLGWIDDTKLRYAKNTDTLVLLDTTTKDYYALLSGRWFKSKSLQKGPWAFVPGDRLPADFAKIPEAHPAGDALAAVAGTPQAEEAAIATGIPQVATVLRAAALLTVIYDGAPQFAAIDGTDLAFALNTATPVVRVAPQSYFAVENGIWFASGNPAGPWGIAGTLPPSLYVVPPSSPVYYTTGARLYGATPTAVYMGYTPAYLGTYVAPWGTVVYGTGYQYSPWLGQTWYGAPQTYGIAAGLRWNAGLGWGFGINSGLCRPWCSPACWNGGGLCNGYGGYYGGAVPLNNVNVFNRWANSGAVTGGLDVVNSIPVNGGIAPGGFSNRPVGTLSFQPTGGALMQPQLSLGSRVPLAAKAGIATQPVRSPAVARTGTTAVQPGRTAISSPRMVPGVSKTTGKTIKR